MMLSEATLTEAKTNRHLLYQTRKKRDLYMWVGNTPTGPSAKFHVHNGTLLT